MSESGARSWTVSPGPLHTAFLDADGNVYMCGFNQHGQLGLGDALDRAAPTKLGAFASSARIRQVAVGDFHTVFLDVEGCVYTCGLNRAGQLGHGDTLNRAVPTRIAALVGHPKIVQVSAGENHTLFLSETGYVYSCGEKLGFHCWEYDLAPKVVGRPEGSRFVQISSSGNHAALLDAEWRVHVFGDGSRGQLGLGDCRSRRVPTKIEALLVNSAPPTIGAPKIVRVATGRDFTVLLDAGGLVYTCGSNHEGQLGHGDETPRVIPTLVQALMPERVTQIAAGKDRAIFFSERTGHVYACGLRGPGGRERDRRVPVPLDHFGDRAASIYAGGRTTALVTARGDVYACGKGENGQLGLGDNTERESLTLVEALK